MPALYDPKTIEKAAQNEWQEKNTFRATVDPHKEKFYCLSMFPYPSGHLHMGHVRNYTIGDVIARTQRMLGKNVLQPIGWDAFGLPAENAAMRHQVHPADWTQTNIASMKAQLQRLGLAYDWQRELTTCHSDYYRWEQWLFTEFYKKGWVYKKNTWVNWDPVDKTVLANEQVVDGRGWRSGALVEKREIAQWFLKITDYADELLQDLEQLSDWPQQVITMQKNWIGRSQGVEIIFQVEKCDITLPVYTTRPDTLMGATYLTIAPEHPLATQAAQNNAEIAAFIRQCQQGSVAEADRAKMDKQGINTGFFAIHPLTQEKLPIYIGNYVLMSYGHGAVMAVPAHDERDFAFAEIYKLPLKIVIQPADGTEHDFSQTAFTEKGRLIHSQEFDGLTSDEAFTAIASALEKKDQGRVTTQYRLHDWGLSRQRYWGTPIPMVHCPKCGTVPVPEKELPVLLPIDKTSFATGAPLEQIEEFYQTTCPECQGPAKRETDTFDTFVESSWYYARFCSPKSTQAIFDDSINYWLPVDQYVGGVEHAVMHLLYARLFHKLLRDLGLLQSNEPFTRLLTQGMVLKDGAKMSKSKGNVVDPNPLIEQYGADTVRLFSMFAAPPDQSLEWSDAGVQGSYRFLKKLWHTVMSHCETTPADLPALKLDTLTSSQSALRHDIHQTIVKVTDDFKRRQTFNTAIAAIMSLFNQLQDAPCETEQDQALLREGFNTIVLLLAPIVPHICHALWPQLGHTETIAQAAFPEAAADALKSDTMTLVVQVNGRLRGHLTVASNLSREAVEDEAVREPNVARFLHDKTIVKKIYVPKKLINIVVAS